MQRKSAMAATMLLGFLYWQKAVQTTEQEPLNIYASFMSRERETHRSVFHCILPSPRLFIDCLSPMTNQQSFKVYKAP